MNKEKSSIHINVVIAGFRILRLKPVFNSDFTIKLLGFHNTDYRAAFVHGSITFHLYKRH